MGIFTVYCHEKQRFTVNRLTELSFTYQIKICDDFVQKSQAFQALVVDVVLDPKFFEIRDGSEHDADSFVRLVVQLLGKKWSH